MLPALSIMLMSKVSSLVGKSAGASQGGMLSGNKQHVVYSRKVIVPEIPLDAPC